ncbi:MAG: PAS domain-containing protein, partial [Proteobacteria bacterium]
MDTTIEHANYFLRGGGIIGMQMRQFDWASSAVGNPSEWPQNLKTTVSLVLSSRFPMLLCWGDDRIPFYNDAFQSAFVDPNTNPVLALQSDPAFWNDRASFFYEKIQNVFSAGDAIGAEDSRVSFPQEGQPEDFFLTYNCSPVFCDAGNVDGVLVICEDTTKNVKSRQQLAQNDRQFKSVIEQAPVATSLFTGPEMTIAVANERMLAFLGKSKDLVGKPLLEAIPELQGQPFPEILKKVYESGETYQSIGAKAELEIDGQIGTFYFDYTYKPVFD